MLQFCRSTCNVPLWNGEEQLCSFYENISVPTFDGEQAKESFLLEIEIDFLLDSV